jgi:tetratricopeptide (TPR) repeat protein
MKIETLITAVIFFGVGFLTGYIYKTERAPVAAVSVAGAPAQTAPPAGGTANSAGTLPPGHPPLSEAAVIDNLQQQAAANPSDPQIPLKLADYCYDKQLYELAIKWYRKALELDPKNVNARTDLGTSLFYSGRPADAITEYQKALAINPNHQPTLFNMIVVNAEGTHNVREAQHYWEILHRRNPTYPGLSRIKQELEALARRSKS